MATQVVISCARCHEPIGPDDTLVLVQGYPDAPVCAECADLWDACVEVGMFYGEGYSERAFFAGA